MLLLAASLSIAGSAQAIAPTAEPVIGDLGCGSAQVTRTLSTGSAWRMCARIHPFKGLVLENVQFRPATGDREYAGWMPVIDSLYLAQLNVPYDTARITFDDITEVGFGDDQLLSQTPRTCDGDTVDIEQSYLRGTQLVRRTIPGICLREIETGLGWHSLEGRSETSNRYSQQEHSLEVSSLSKTGWYEYQQRVTFTDQGAITVGLGATGDLAPGTLFFPNDPALGWQIGETASDEEDHHAASHWHNAVYRVDFGIGSGPQQVEQWDYGVEAGGVVRGQGTVRKQAFVADDPKPTTWWRVLNPASLNPDGHPRSYEIVNDSMQDPYLPLTKPVASFTNDHACQEYASENLNAECPGQSVLDYVTAETTPLTNPVAWVSVGYHHVVRDEDQSPMPVHWQSFSLVPRDLLAQQATTPIERSCENGYSTGKTGSCAAVNLTPPVIATSAPTLGPGTVLTADVGTWRDSRAPLSFQWIWLRDGASVSTTGKDGLPSSATGQRYVVTHADVGHSISVQVTAAAGGIIPGSATSAPLIIPTPSPGLPPQAQATRPTVRVKVSRGSGRKARPRLRIVVKGIDGPATGAVTIRRHGTELATRRLQSGRTRVVLPRTRGHRYRIKVIYEGNAFYQKASRTIWVRPRRSAARMP